MQIPTPTLFFPRLYLQFGGINIKLLKNDKKLQTHLKLHNTTSKTHKLTEISMQQTTINLDF